MKALKISIREVNDWYNKLPENKTGLNEIINSIPKEYIPAYIKIYRLEVSTLKKGPRKGQYRVDSCRSDCWRYNTHQELLEEIYGITSYELRYLKELHTIANAYVSYMECTENPWKKLEFEKQILRFEYLYKPIFTKNEGWLEEYNEMKRIIDAYLEQNEIRPYTADEWSIRTWTSNYAKLEKEMTTRRKDLEFKDDMIEINY